MQEEINQQLVESAGSLEFLAKQAVEGFITGLHKSPFHGFSVEFAEHRLYNNGESTRHIDWKLFARTEKLFVKRYEEETNLRCQLVIDQSSSMYFPQDTKGFNKLEFSIHAAASLMILLRKQRDAVGLSLFDETVTLHTPSRSSMTHQRYVFHELEQILKQKPETKKTSATDALHQIAEQLHRRSLVFIFSDMVDNSHEGTEELFAALQHLRYNKHEVVLFNVVDRQHEIDFKLENQPYRFIDMESGEEVKLNPASIQSTYKAAAEAYETNLKLFCGQNRIDFVEADVNQPVDQVLMAYLIKRSKMV